MDTEWRLGGSDSCERRSEAINKTHPGQDHDKVKHDIVHISKVKNTWEVVLGKTEELPDGWIYLREVLVGTRERV